MAKKLKVYNGSSWEDVTFAITPPSTSVTNSFTTNQVIEASTSAAALRVTQTGSGEALRVEDSSNPDSTPFVIDASGNVGVGYAAPNTKLEIRSANALVDGYGLVTIGSNNFGVDNGGSLSFSGVISSDNNQSNFVPYAQIGGRKENSTSGNYAGYLSFATRIHTGALTERMRIASDGITTFNNVIYAPNFNSSITTAQSGVNLNTIVNSGFYRMNTGQVNGPGMDWGQLLVIHGGADTITQIYGDYNSGSLFTRSGNPSDVGGGGSWQPWRQIVDTINGGKITVAQSTTDARIRNIYTSTSSPSGGIDGDMWAVYV
jgi:hypothetical protein